MLITNRQSVDHSLTYKVGGVSKRRTIDANSSVTITEISSISQIVFKSWERKARGINQRFGGHPAIRNARVPRFIDTKVDYRASSASDPKQ